MLELGYVRANLDRVRQALESRGAAGQALDEFEAFDKERREAITEAEQLKAKRNQTNAEVGKLKKEGQDASHLFAEMKEVSGRIKELDKRAGELDSQMQDFLLTIPNIPHESVPKGKTEADNREEKTWGEQPQFDFEPKAHWDLGPELGILDFERAAKITGARFAVYQGAGARLERALANFMLDVHTKQVCR
jgi:seryl-tRNA synthetase